MALAGFLALAFVTPAMAAPPEKSDADYTVLQARKTRARGASKTRVRKKRKRARLRSGAYVTGGLGLVNVNDQPAKANLQSGTLMGIGVGYRLDPKLAVEGNLLAQFHDSINNGQDSTGENTLTGGTISMKYIFPIDLPRMEGYGEAGLGYLNLGTIAGEEKISGTTINFGGGIEYRLSKEFALGGRLGYTSMLEASNSTGTATADFSALSAMITFNVQL